jgi:hypothetical protein
VDWQQRARSTGTHVSNILSEDGRQERVVPSVVSPCPATEVSHTPQPQHEQLEPEPEPRPQPEPEPAPESGP